MARGDRIEDVSAVVGKVLRKLEKKNNTGQALVFSSWDTIVGEEMAAHVVPDRISRKKLFLNTDSSAWLFEIAKKEKEQILRKIENVVGSGVIEEIVLRVNSIKTR